MEFDIWQDDWCRVWYLPIERWGPCPLYLSKRLVTTRIESSISDAVSDSVFRSRNNKLAAFIFSFLGGLLSEPRSNVVRKWSSLYRETDWRCLHKDQPSVLLSSQPTISTNLPPKLQVDPPAPNWAHSAGVTWSRHRFSLLCCPVLERELLFTVFRTMLCYCIGNLPATWYSCPHEVSSPWVRTGFGDLILMKEYTKNDGMPLSVASAGLPSHSPFPVLALRESVMLRVSGWRCLWSKELTSTSTVHRDQRPTDGQAVSALRRCDDGGPRPQTTPDHRVQETWAYIAEIIPRFWTYRNSDTMNSIVLFLEAFRQFTV